MSGFQQGEKFTAYKNGLGQVESKESERRDFLFEREQKLISDMAHNQKSEEHEKMRKHTANYYDKIKDQVSGQIIYAILINNWYMHFTKYDLRAIVFISCKLLFFRLKSMKQKHTMIVP